MTVSKGYGGFVDIEICFIRITVLELFLCALGDGGVKFDSVERDCGV